jgi:molybdenum cofactor synthesis domain-containing protein
MSLRLAIITASDTRDYETDSAGAALKDLAGERGWDAISHVIVADDQAALEAALRSACDDMEADIVLTCGGTGFSLRDVTPEATAAICDRMAPGIAEVIRARSLEVTGRAMLSRGASGLRGQSVIINFPGSEKAARQSWSFVADQFEHAVEMLHGGGH